MGRLLLRSWNLAVDDMGTSGLALVGGLFIFALILWRKWRREGKAVVLKDWKGELGYGIVLTVIWWVCVFGYALGRTLWNDHTGLVERGRIIRENEQRLKGELDVKERLISDLRAAKQSKSPALRTPPTIADDRPILVGLRFTQTPVQSPREDLPFGKEVVIQTDKTIEPVSMVLICDGEIGAGTAGFAGSAAYTIVSVGPVTGNPKAFLIAWYSPRFTPEAPIIARLFSKQSFRILRLAQIPWTSVNH
jgi:hypothetical protein